MSSHRGQPLFSGGMYELLSKGAAEHEEAEEEEVPVETPVKNPSGSQNQTATLSKSARKRLARQASKGVDGKSKSNKQSGSETESPGTPSVPGAEKFPEANIETVTPQDAPRQQASTAPKTELEQFTAGPSQIPPLEKQIPDVTPKATKPVTAVPEKKEENKEQKKETPKKAEAARSSSPPSSNFSPSLPATLPQPTGNALPANRKRKTPQDFTPAGPGNVMNSASPSKIAVKFEDGLAPGEGKEGEKTIAPKKNRNMIERTIWTFIMIGGFITLLCMGHPYMILLVMLCQTLVYKEVTALFDLRDHGGSKAATPGEEGDSWNKTINWYFFVVANYFLYGESIIYYFKHIVFVDAYFIPFARNHRFISFMLYVVGFVGFVANLQRQYLRQQFALFCWVHISLLLVVVSSHFIVNNILEGLVWFFVPASLVICNDVMAYVCGKLFGKTPLIKLSPKKTVEGFVGAFICTLLFGIAWGTFWMRYPYMICPARDLGTNVFSEVACRPNPVFMWHSFEFTGVARQLLQTILGHPPPSIPYAPFQIHCLVMATFASLVAPFGGFFASGFKRAFNIKDFGHSIPGHGGMTDRMDCQFMMGLFSYVYYSSLIRIQNVTVGGIMQAVVTSLTQPEQIELLYDLKRFLAGQGVKV
ncbi:phosphatidate cytidylyltransferase [Cryptococcus neoformans]|nr:phosphatidate cytidylyltransferase [Cryptococcus neoformans var. grubii Th84]OXG81796.1 phosphatidate cytidylyltransferase [Cryptococcus neoformans var. grubii MW-RSA36]OXH11312.1 phosphatidate cytidylyltransferase [Cryptococcus neoformans var. grubii]OXL08556.1 phosphatidate cytidylyltransferase [Cryptococcus neoformans var. grubii Gb118]OXH32154.1 phosphatidate cytidylyltransferase [Cryptococcus neoformans var. grubii]